MSVSEHRDHNIVTASLETLQQVVRGGPSLLGYLLTSPAGLGKSRLTFDQVRTGIRYLTEYLLDKFYWI